jgi:hypothetical protein
MERTWRQAVENRGSLQGSLRWRLATVVRHRRAHGEAHEKAGESEGR